MASLPADIDRRSFDPRFREAWLPRQRVWNALRSFDRPCVPTEIHRLSGVGLGLVARLMIGWAGRGLLTRHPNSTRYTMTDDARLRRNPPMLETKRESSVPRRSGRQRMWSAMRVLKTFDLPTLGMAAETSEENARIFVRALLTTRYLSVIGETAALRPLFRLTRNTGPLHPVLRTRNEGALTVVDLKDRNDGSVRRVRTCLPPAIESDAELASDDGGVS